MDNFRAKEKLKTVAKLDLLEGILQDIETLDLSKSGIKALLAGYKDGLTWVLNIYEDKEVTKDNAPLHN